MLETKEKLIGDKLFRVTQIGTKVSRPIFLRLIRILSPLASGLFSNLPEDDNKKGSLLDKTVSMKAIGGALSQLPYVLKDEDFDYFFNSFAPHTEFQMPNGNFVRLHLNGNDLNAFGADLLLQFQWLYFCIEVNFGNFLDALGGLNGLSSKLQAATQSESPNISTGMSTESLSANITNAV